MISAQSSLLVRSGTILCPAHPQYTLAVYYCLELHMAFIFAGIYAGLVGSAMIMSFARAILFFYVCVIQMIKFYGNFCDVNPIGEYCAFIA